MCLGWGGTIIHFYPWAPGSATGCNQKCPARCPQEGAPQQLLQVEREQKYLKTCIDCKYTPGLRDSISSAGWLRMQGPGSFPAQGRVSKPPGRSFFLLPPLVDTSLYESFVLLPVLQTRLGSQPWPGVTRVHGPSCWISSNGVFALRLQLSLS